jgi:hypothetical protein
MNQAELLERLRQVARPIMLNEVVRLDSCIAMTRCAIEVLRAFGLEAQPANVEVVAANQTFMRLMGEGNIRMEDKLPDWAVAEGAWAVGLGLRPKDEEVGHVVAILDDQVIDLSLDQASRPQRGIVLEPLVGTLPDNYRCEPWVYKVDEAYVTYHLRADLKKWLMSRDWHRFRERYGKQTGQIIRELRK